TVTSPQDLAFSTLGNFVISAGSSLWVFDLNAPPGTAGPVASIPGAVALAAFRFPSSVETVLATNDNANSVYLIQPAPATPKEFGLSNGASFAQAPLAPGSLASGFASTGATQELKASSLPLPTALGGVSLRIGGGLNFDTPSNKWLYSAAGSFLAAL